jgi:ABC-2 type transport system ATP-binding protein
LIQIENLNFSYTSQDRPALQGLCLSVRAGSLFGLLGPNGSGKTTLISILSGLLPAPRSSVTIAGLELNKNLPAIQAFSALVPQDYAFYPRLTVAENLNFFAGVQSLPAFQAPARTSEVLEITGLASAGEKRAERLSGGMKRRLNIAIGLLNRPRLLFLDEPTVGIDPQSRGFILDAVKRIRKAGTTVVYTTHYMEEVEAICDEIGVLDHGQLLVKGSLRELLTGSQGGQLTLHLGSRPDAKQKKALHKVRGLKFAAGVLKMDACSQKDFHALLALLRAQKLPVSRVRYGYGNLEELFMHLTKRQLRD